MARSQASRKYQITMNNPTEHGFSHTEIKEILAGLAGVIYWCLCDEIGKEGTPHTHLYVVFQNAVMFTTLQKRFYGAHIEPANGSHQENRNYICKEGKWQDDDKNETNLPDTFEEYGEMPLDRASGKKETEEIYALIKQDYSNYEILELYPNAMNKLDKIERARQTVIEERHKKEFRKLQVTYICGEPGIGKTRRVMEQYGYENVYRVTNYAHPFDGYKGQDVIMFEEFRSSLTIGEMLVYLEGYSCSLPCRYADKISCYTQVFIVSNIPFERQYPNVQAEEPETWKAFFRRFQCKIVMDGTGTTVYRHLFEEDQPTFQWVEDVFENEGKESYV